MAHLLRSPGCRSPQEGRTGRRWQVALLAAGLVLVVTTTTGGSAGARTDPAPTAVGGRDLGPVRVRPLGTPAPGTTVQGLWSSPRDCGMSSRLSNGRILWVWCDSAMFDHNNVQTGNAASSTGVIAAADDPRIMEDVLVKGRLTPLVPAQQHYPCDGFRAAWPHGVVTLPDADGRIATDRVAIWFENICHHPVDGSWVYEKHGIGVALLETDARRGPEPLQATVLRADLFPSGAAGHQFGAVLGPPGRFDRVHLYACESEGSCTVRRVSVSADPAADAARLASPAAYQGWDGARWVTGGRASAPVITGTGASRFSDTGVSVVWVPRLQRYAAVYLPWPGIHHEAVVITARSPEGPWSPPAFVPLPSCGTVARCYAVNLHTHLGGTDTIGVSYLRSLDFYGQRNGTWRWFARAHLGVVPLGPARPACATADGVRFDAEVHLGGAAYRWRRLDGTWWSWLTIPGGPWKGRPALVDAPGSGLDLVLTSASGDLWRLRRTDGAGFGAAEQLTAGLGASGEIATVAQRTGVEVFVTTPDGVVRRVHLPEAGGAERTGPVAGLPSPVVALDAAGGPDGTVVLALVLDDGTVTVRSRAQGRWSTWPATTVRAMARGGVAVAHDDAGRPTVTVLDRARRPTVVTWPAEGSPTIRRPGSYLPLGGALAGCTDPSGAAVVVGTAPDLMAGRQLTATDPADPATLGPVGAR